MRHAPERRYHQVCPLTASFFFFQQLSIIIHPPHSQHAITHSVCVLSSLPLSHPILFVAEYGEPLSEAEAVAEDQQGQSASLLLSSAVQPGYTKRQRKPNPAEQTSQQGQGTLWQVRLVLWQQRGKTINRRLELELQMWLLSHLLLSLAMQLVVCFFPVFKSVSLCTIMPHFAHNSSFGFLLVLCLSSF